MKIRRRIGSLSILFLWLCAGTVTPTFGETPEDPESQSPPPAEGSAPVEASTAPETPPARTPTSTDDGDPQERSATADKNELDKPNDVDESDNLTPTAVAGDLDEPNDVDESDSLTPTGVADEESDIDLAASPEIAEIVEEIETAFDIVSELVRTKREELSGKTSTTALDPELHGALEEWANAGDEADDKTVKRKELLDLLEYLRATLELDLLMVVTQAGDTLSAPIEPAGAEQAGVFHDEARRAAETSLREARASFGTATLSTTRRESRHLSEPGLFLSAASPIFLRPDAPHSVLIGAVSLASCAERVKVALDQNVASLDWHIFRVDDAGESTVIAGPRIGQTPSGSLVEELVASASTTGSIVTDGPPLGLWERLVDTDGRLVGGWGIDVNQDFLDTLLSSTSGEIKVARTAQPAAPGNRDAQMKLFFLILAATGGVGLLLVIVLAFVSMLRRRRADRGLAVVEGLADLPTSAPTNGKDVVSQFEQNWKTFASYTQDLLQESLKEIEQAPQQDVKDIRERVELAFEEIVHTRKDINRLQSLQKEAQSSSPGDAQAHAATLVEIKNQLSIARDEVKNSANGVVRRLTAALGELAPPQQLSGDFEDLIRRVELELLETKQGFGLVNETVLKVAEILGDRQAHEIERSIDDEVARARAEWEARESEYQHQLEHAGQQLEPLTKDLEEARRNERDLRVDLEEAAGRCAQLESELEEEKAKTEFLTTEREEAWRRERKVVEELREAESRQSDGQDKVPALEASLHELTVEVEELRGREAELRGELEQSHASENEAHDQLKDLREGEERVRKEYEEERRQLIARIERLTAKHAELEKQPQDDPAERDRLRDQTDAQTRELETLRSAFEALKVEKQHLMDESARLTSEAAERLEENDANAQSLRAELAKVKADLASSKAQLNQHNTQAAFHDEVLDELRGTVAEQESELARNEIEISELQNRLEVVETTSGTVDVERLQTSLIDTGKELRHSLKERLSLNTQIKEREAVWQSRLNTLELQVSDANRKLTEMQSKLLESDQIIRDLEAQLGTVHETTRADARTYERIQILKREKQDLVRSLDKLKKELGAANADCERMGRLHGALIEGGVSAIVACDKKLKVFTWNPAAERVWEQTAGEVQDRSLAELALTPKGEITALAQATLKSGRPESIEDLVWSHPERDVRHLRVHCDPIKGPDKKVEGVVICVDDITQEIEQRMEARLQNLFAESLTESLPSALVVLDGRDRVTTWNRVAERLFGVDSDSAIGKELFSLETPLGKSVFRRRFLKAKEQNKQKKLRIRMDIGGAPAQCVVTQCPFTSKADTPCGTLLLVEELGVK